MRFILDQTNFNEKIDIMKKHDTRTKVERNKEILRLHVNEKWSYSKLARYFGISSSRIMQIIHREQRKEEAKQPAVDSGQKFYTACLYATLSLEIDEKQATRVYNCLRRAKIVQELKPGRHILSKYPDEYLLLIRNFGPTSLKIARLADDIF